MTEAERLILLTNDDGVHATGLETARRALSRFGRVVVVAPLQERSGASHSLSLHDPVRIHKLAEDRFGTTGTPVDCVVLAFRKLLSRLPDLVVSGINHGGNLGEDVLYSGTVAAAREAAVYRIPSFAVSLVSRREEYFESAGLILGNLVGELWPRGAAGTFWNVNIPEGQPEGYQFTRQGTKRITSDIVEKTDLRGRTYYWIGADQSQWTVAPETDYDAVLQKRVSVTPMQLAQTDFQVLAELKGLELKSLEPETGDPS